MKVLEIIPSWIAGGAEVFVINLCNELSKHDDVHVTLLTFYPHSNKTFLQHRLSAAVSTDVLPKRKKIDFSLPYRLNSYIERQNFDIIHVHLNAISYVCMASLLSKRKRKFFVTIHNDAYKEATGVNRFIRKLLFYFNLARPITISNESQVSFKKVYHCESSLICNGVPIPDMKFDREANKGNIASFVSVAAIHPVKNSLALARAANKLGNMGYGLKVEFIGKPADFNYTEALKNEESTHVTYLGEVDNPLDYLLKADFFVLPSFYEGLPISLLEAMSVCCIPIVTPVGGCKDIVINDVNGFIIEDHTEENIMKAMIHAMDCSDCELARMRNHISNNISSFSIENCANQHLNLFLK